MTAIQPVLLSTVNMMHRTRILVRPTRGRSIWVHHIAVTNDSRKSANLTFAVARLGEASFEIQSQVKIPSGEVWHWEPYLNLEHPWRLTVHKSGFRVLIQVFGTA